MSAPTPEVVECATCRRMFRDTDGTRVCPEGHENPWAEDEDDEVADHLRKVTW